MTSRPHRRPPLATFSPLLAALAFALLSQGGAASAGPFNLVVETWVYPIPPGDVGGSGGVVIEITADLGLGPYDWYLGGIGLLKEPQTRDGDSLSFDILDYWFYPEFLPPGALLQGILGVAWIWPETPYGRYSGGAVGLYAYRYDEWGNRHEETDSVTFGFTVPGPAAAPEPAAAISAAIAVGVGVVVAARRRLPRPC